MVRSGANRADFDLLGGPVAKTLVSFATPLFLANLCQTAYNIIDMVVVGWNVGGFGLSGVSVGTDIVHFLTFLSFGMANAAQVIIARHLGARDYHSVRLFIGTLLMFMFLCSSIVTIAALAVTPWALDLMNTPAEAYASARSYMFICVCGMPFLYLYNSLAAVFRAFGDSRTPLALTFFASLVNIVLDLMFVVVLGYGVAGAAAATVIGQIISFVGALIHLGRYQTSYGFTFAITSFKMDHRSLSALVRLGVPMALQSASVMFSKVFVGSWVNSYGLAVSAATGVGVRLASVGQLYSSAVASASSVMVARCLGAGDYARTKRVIGLALAVNGMLAAVYITLVFVAPQLLFGMFTDDASVLVVGREYVAVLALELAFMAARAPMMALVNGSGKPALNLLIALLDGVVGRIGLGLFLGFACDLGYFGFWLGGAFAGLMPVLVGLGYLASGAWRKG